MSDDPIRIIVREPRISHSRLFGVSDFCWGMGIGLSLGIIITFAIFIDHDDRESEILDLGSLAESLKKINSSSNI